MRVCVCIVYGRVHALDTVSVVARADGSREGEQPHLMHEMSARMHGCVCVCGCVCVIDMHLHFPDYLS